MIGKVHMLLPFQPDHWGLLGESAQNWIASFEENEGYDSDHDAIADNDELSGAFKVASDPQDFDSPHRRQAMYFPGKDAALQSLPETAEDHPRRGWIYSDEPAFAQYTVECWVMPETVDPNVPQTVIERAVWTDWSNGGDQELLRRNFQIAIRNGFWYTKFDSGTLSGTCVEVLSDVPAEAGKWTHVAATYGNGVLRLYVNGVEEGESKAFEGAPWNYPWCVEVGQIGWSADGSHKDPSDCVFRNFWYFYKPLTGEEIKGL